MSRSSPYPAPGRLRHGTSQQDISLDDILKCQEAVAADPLPSKMVAPDISSGTTSKQNHGAHLASDRNLKYALPSRLRRGTSQQDIDISMIIDISEPSQSGPSASSKVCTEENDSNKPSSAD